MPSIGLAPPFPLVAEDSPRPEPASRPALPRRDPRLYQIATLGSLLSYGLFALHLEVRPEQAVAMLATVLAAQYAATRLARLYAALEGLIALSGLLLPLAFAQAPSLLRPLYGEAGGPAFRAGAVALSRVDPRARPLLYGLATLICAGRPYLGMHYPSDVLAGAALGLAVGDAWPLPTDHRVATEPSPSAAPSPPRTPALELPPAAASPEECS